MGNFLLGFFTALILVVGAYKFYGAICRRLLAKKWYQVKKIESSPTNGIWLVDFLHSDGGIGCGYCKKEPPANVEFKNLKVYIKHFNTKICLYHVHWEIFPDENGSN